jgi:predicted DNA-binding protein
MSHQNLAKPTYRQFPIRLEVPLADALDRYSEATNIPKTTISRIALTKFLNQLENSGARAVLQQVCSLKN